MLTGCRLCHARSGLDIVPSARSGMRGRGGLSAEPLAVAQSRARYRHIHRKKRQPHGTQTDSNSRNPFTLRSGGNAVNRGKPRPSGALRMADVAEKPVTARRAAATVSIRADRRVRGRPIAAPYRRATSWPPRGLTPIDRERVIERLQLESNGGGHSGNFQRSRVRRLAKTKQHV